MILNKLSQEKIVMIIAAAVFVVFSIGLKDFFTQQNIFTLLKNVSILGILSIAMAIVVLGRGIDLSIVSTMIASVAWSFYLGNHGYSLPTALLLGLGFALLIGLLNGLLVAYAEIPAIFCTLATGTLVYGFGRFVLTDFEVSYTPANAQSIAWLANKYILGIVPMPVIMFIIVALLCAIFLRLTRPGRQIYSIGDNLEASRIVGIPVRPIIVLQYTLCALVGFIAGLIMSIMAGSASMRMAITTFIYDILLVVVIGGISLSGGRGGVRNVIVGTLLIGILLNGMTIMDIQYTLQNVIKSSILLIAIIIDSLMNPRDEQTAQQGDI